MVGSGIAGLTAALHAVDGGCRVTLATKDVLEHANTRFAQGGIAAVTGAADSVAEHVRDTLVAGSWLNDPAAVQVLAVEGPDRVRELVARGVAFDLGADGAPARGLEAAHSHARVLHAGGDATGSAIERALVAALAASGVQVLEHAFLCELVIAAGRVRGVRLLVDGAERVLAADAVVLATGGVGQLYRPSTNPLVATGDGIAAALRAGAAVADLEFVQFHPTVLAAHDPFLISEAVRGEGAVLVDEAGRRFAFDAHPDGELAPRDVVARTIAARIREQHGRPVHLDATGLRSDPVQRARFLAERFPTIDQALRARGVDWANEPVPVTPAAHYLMGGIVTDLHGRTTLPGLYAVGEVARTGVHGANRLASNSLLEGAVFGARAGDRIAADAASGEWPQAVPGAPAPAPAPASAATGAVPPFARAALQQLMWEHAGLVRDAAGLEHAASVIAAWRRALPAPVTVTEREDANLLLVAAHVVAAALARTESIGAHYRADAPAAEAAVLAGTAVSC